MAVIKISLPDELENRFRQAAMAQFGYHKGALSAAAKVALEQYTREVEVKRVDVGDPIEAIRGMLRGIKGSSVDIAKEGVKHRYDSRR